MAQFRFGGQFGKTQSLYGIPEPWVDLVDTG